MIEAKDLRIGNLVVVPHHGIQPVWSILGGPDKSRIYWSPHNNAQEFLHLCDPIPLTPQWLERCGFEKRDLEEIRFDFPKDEFFYWRNNELLWNDGLYDRHTSKPYKHVLYVHQLQNLFYALTSQELTIKE